MVWSASNLWIGFAVGRRSSVIKKRFYKFDGNKLHFVKPFQGRRYSLVYFMCDKYVACTPINEMTRGTPFSYSCDRNWKRGWKRPRARSPSRCKGPDWRSSNGSSHSSSGSGGSCGSGNSSSNSSTKYVSDPANSGQKWTRPLLFQGI